MVGGEGERIERVWSRSESTMLGRTAAGLFWMFRYLERSDNVARLTQAGIDIAAGTPSDPAEAWRSVLASAAIPDDVISRNSPKGQDVINYMLCEPDNPSSVRTLIALARNNGRGVRTGLSRETWEAVNDTWMVLERLLSRRVTETNAEEVLNRVRRQGTVVYGTLHNTMLRTDNFAFCRLGTSIERADYTARILDVKYHVLLPTAFHVGGPLDNVQWENILRSVSGLKSYLWLNQGEISASGIADYLILDERMPRSINFSVNKVAATLAYLERFYGQRHRCHDLIDDLKVELSEMRIDDIMARGLHEFILELSSRNAAVASQIESDYRFYR